MKIKFDYEAKGKTKDNKEYEDSGWIKADLDMKKRQKTGSIQTTVCSMAKHLE